MLAALAAAVPSESPTAVLAVSADGVKQLAVVVIIALLVMAILSAWVIKKLVTKLITVGILVALVVAVYSQRSSVADCADQVKAKAKAGDFSSQTCSFFGKDVTIPGRDS
jgi:hypothetical protein